MSSHKIPWLAAIVVAATSGSGCGGYGDYCVEERECEHLNDADEQACTAAFDAGKEVAAIYNCSSQWDALTECVIDESTCEGVDNQKTYTSVELSGDQRDRCDNEKDNLSDCLEGASERDDIGTSDGSDTETSGGGGI